LQDKNLKSESSFLSFLCKPFEPFCESLFAAFLGAFFEHPPNGLTATWLESKKIKTNH
jgi:hypothetical protein